MKTTGKSCVSQLSVDITEGLPEFLAGKTRALIIGPYTTRQTIQEAARHPEARLEEAEGLAKAIHLEVAASLLLSLNTIRPATYLGKGKVEEIGELIEDQQVSVVSMDCQLTPVQQRNLEKAWGAKVIDRTALILEIFGERARTKEGALQVELAHLAYQKSRLVRSWTHLERQRGGFGFLGGPGETQIETDRRLIEERMRRIELDLDKVKRTRGLHRKKRRDIPYPVVALIGYTNAGKSTLFNRLTQSDVLAKDMLFATLDPTLREIRLPHGARALLSDTVGFISDLPTMLISAFRATLEEVTLADIILHVRDVSHEDSDAQSQDVAKILDELGLKIEDESKIIEVWNKIDALTGDELSALQLTAQGYGAGRRPMLVSSLTGLGLDELLTHIEKLLFKNRATLTLVVPPEDGEGLAWLYANTEVISRNNRKSGATKLTIRVGPERYDAVKKRFDCFEKVISDS